MTDPTDRFEYAAAGEELFNYCLWPYAPAAEQAGKFRAVNLLYHSFAVAGAHERCFELVDRVRAAVGVGRTVWGVKKLGDRTAWEFYFYDYRRRERERSIAKVLDVVRPVMRCPVVPNERLPYFMFSLDVNDELLSGARALSEVHMYVGNVGSSVSSGISYSLRADETVLENFYFFFDARTQRTDIIAKVCCSAQIDSTAVDVDAILWPELMDCTTVCIANKARSDCAYFSGLRVDQLLLFLERLAYPEATVAFVRENRSMLDHLLFDVGLDYRSRAGQVEILKSGYYAFF
ncbi:MAG: hypothetical protein NTV86_12425 [Planctomycetota bacterium]|nr:hypothetical protein [Planctomycetota bacterium]